MRQARDLAERTIKHVGNKLDLAKHFVRTEPCARSYAYRRHVKFEGSRARRRADQAVVDDELVSLSDSGHPMDDYVCPLCNHHDDYCFC